MRKCIRCGSEMKENCAIDSYGGIELIDKNKKLFKRGLGAPKVAICPKCGEVSIYLEDVSKLNS